MKDIIASIAESKISEAIKKGDFDNLQGKGKPLKLEDLSYVPEGLRASYTILKNSGYLPEEIQLNKEIVNLKRLINSCCDEEEKKTLNKKLVEMNLQYNLSIEKRRRY